MSHILPSDPKPREKSFAELKSQMLPFFQDLSIKSSMRNRGNKKFSEGKVNPQHLKMPKRNKSRFKIQEIEWRNRFFPSFSSNQEEKT